MSNIEEHMRGRNSRYYINAETKSFKNILKGLAVIEVCITELCTRRCGFCPRADKTVYPNQRLFMSLETITNLGNQCSIKEYECDFHFSGFGESLTHPQFFDLVKTLKNILPNNHFALTTNGDLLTEKTCNNIYDSGINHIIVSCYDGPDEYEKFDSLLSSTKKSYEIRKLWLNPNDTLDTLAKRNNFNNRSGAVSTIDYQESLEAHKTNPCYLPFYKLVIDHNGEALLCCNDWFRRHKGFGNINNNTLQEIWFSEEFTKVRNNLKEGKRIGPSCSTCSIQGNLVGTESVMCLS